MNLTWDQISGPADRIILVGLTWLVSKGYIPAGDVPGYATLALGVLGAFYGWWVNRPKAIVQSAAALSGTTVITSPALAAAAPQQNVMSSATTQVVPK